MITADPVPILADNYAWLLRDQPAGAVAIVDPAEESPIASAIDAAGGRLDLILLTHHHADHIAAADAIRQRYGARVVGARADSYRLPKLDQAVTEGDTVRLGDSLARVIETPGHTVGHVSYVFDNDAIVLCGDTLFSLGCGRLLEGSAADLFASLRKLAELPQRTKICCGHEYTLANARFARHVDPENAALAAYAERVAAWRAAGRPSLPSLLSDELACNPFLRAPDVASLADLRRRKDHF